MREHDLDEARAAAQLVQAKLTHAGDLELLAAAFLQLLADLEEDLDEERRRTTEAEISAEGWRNTAKRNEREAEDLKRDLAAAKERGDRMQADLDRVRWELRGLEDQLHGIAR